jgi:hypothetical protein
MIADVLGVDDGELVRCYWIGIGEMEMYMYRMMGLLNPRNFLQSRSPRRRSDQLKVPRLDCSFLLPSSSESNYLSTTPVDQTWSIYTTVVSCHFTSALQHTVHD